MQKPMKLGYYKVRGRAQCSRHLLSYCEIPFQDIQYTMEQWWQKAKYEIDLDFPNLPYLIDGNCKITQSKVIPKYIAKKSGKKSLLGKNAQDAAVVDMLIDAFEQLSMKIVGIIYKMTGKDWQKQRVSAYLKYQPQLDAINKMLDGKDYFLGYLTIADFFIGQYTYGVQRVIGPEFNIRYGNLIKLREKVESLIGVQTYYDRPDAVKQQFTIPSLINLSWTLQDIKRPIVLGYHAIRGRFQFVRHLLSYLGLEFVQKIYYDARKEWHEKDKHQMNIPFANLPYLLDGHVAMTQSMAIPKYLAKRACRPQLLGKTAQDRARVDQMISAFEDIVQPVINFLFDKNNYEQKRLQYVEKTRSKLIEYNNLIESKQFIIGYITIADFIIGEYSYYLQLAFGQQFAKIGSNLIKIRYTIQKIPEVQNYYKRPEANAVSNIFLPLAYTGVPTTMQVVNNALKGQMPSPPKPMIIGYHAIRGRMQFIRHLASYLGLNFEEKLYTDPMKQWHQKDKQQLGIPFANLPYLLDGDLAMTESIAIPKYLVNKSGRRQLLGRTAQDKARVDQMISAFEDMLEPSATLIFDKAGYSQKLPAFLDKLRPKLIEYNNLLEGKQFIIGYLTIADFIIGQFSYFLQFVFGSEFAKIGSNLIRIRQTIQNIPQVQNYYKRPNAVKQVFLPPPFTVSPFTLETVNNALLGKKSESSPIIFGYFPTRGRGQMIRHVLSYLNLPFTDRFYVDDQKQWYEKDKKQLNIPFANLPYLIDGDIRLTQSTSIPKYLAKRANRPELLGKTAQDKARVDMLISAFEDIVEQSFKLFFDKQNYKKRLLGDLQKLRPKLTEFNKALQGKQFAIGYITVADFIISEYSYLTQMIFGKQFAKIGSNLIKIRNKVENIPQVQNYYKRENAVKNIFAPSQMTGEQWTFETVTKALTRQVSGMVKIQEKQSQKQQKIKQQVKPKTETKPKKQINQSEILTLGYYPIRGRAQYSRYVLAYSGLKFQEKLYTDRAEWFQVDKQKLDIPFPNLPYLIDGDLKITESKMIPKYVAKKSGNTDLLGKTPQDTGTIEMIIDYFEELTTPFTMLFFNKKWQVQKMNLLFKHKKKLEKINAMLANKDYFLGYLTLADFFVAESTYYIQKIIHPEFDSFKNLIKLRERIQNLPQIQAYYQRQNAVKGPFMFSDMTVIPFLSPDDLVPRQFSQLLISKSISSSLYSPVKSSISRTESSTNKQKYHVLAFSGSLRKHSTNTGLLKACIQIGHPNLDIQIVNISNFPLFNSDLLENGTPNFLKPVLQSIKKCDGVIFAIPEYNSNISAPLKNAFDWISVDPSPLSKKPAGMISCASIDGGLKAQKAFIQTCEFIQVNIMEKHTINIINNEQNFDSGGNLINISYRTQLKQFLKAFEDFIRKSKM